MPGLSLADSTKLRLELSKKQQDEISTMYSQLAKETRKKAEALKGIETTSAALRTQYLKKLEKELSEAAASIGVGLNKKIQKDMQAVSGAVAEDGQNFLKKIDIPIEGAYSYVAKDVVESIISGKVYGGNWSLKKAIWSDTQKTQQDINKIIAAGVAENKSSYDIAKDLEKYVDPKARKDWEWNKVYPGTKKVVDYNAQRLARTMVSHAYQQSLVAIVKDNPFVTGIKWRSALIHGRTCQICQDRDGKIFPKDDLPLDHPNGLCTFLVDMDDMKGVGSRLGDWVKGNSDPELDKFALSIGWK